MKMKNFIRNYITNFKRKGRNLTAISDISKDNIQNTIKRNVFFLLFSKPNIYLKVLVLRTLGMGFFTLIVWYTIKSFEISSFTIPSAMHSLIGIVIGLLLVFRTNTAYDRWWDGRKIIASLSSEVSIITAKLDSLDKTKINGFDSHYETAIKQNLSSFLLSLRNYLTKGQDNEPSNVFYSKQTSYLRELFNSVSYLNHDENVKSLLNNSFLKIMEYSNQLERIKNTPIPLSYVFHIKISMMIYLLTLPFGMFLDLGIWSVPLVMLIYYIIAGVEIISSEIENPFAGDPNDLPTYKLFKTMLETLKT
jgi:putative membrane protein